MKIRPGRRFLGMVLAVAMLFCTGIGGTAYATADPFNGRMQKAAQYLTRTVAQPTVSATGGEWVVLGLARSGAAVPQGYFEGYYERVKQVLRESGGVLSHTKYSEYSRLILALTAIGKDVTNVAGYNLLDKLSNFDAVKKQGINGPVFALIALDSYQYEIPALPGEGTQTTRDGILEYILSREIKGGGFSLDGKTVDPDTTAMVLQALSRYTDRESIAQAAERAVLKLSSLQNPDGGFVSYQYSSVESIAQTLAALSSLGIDVMRDSRFIKTDGQGRKNNLVSALLDYQTDEGGFSHTLGDTTDGMASEQALYGMAAYLRLVNQKTALYDMTDVVIGQQPQEPPSMFADLEGHWAKDPVLALAKRGIVSGMQEGLFAPDQNMTRAQFATIVVKALSMPAEGETVFADCSRTDWFYGYVAAASQAGLILGKTPDAFCPQDFVTREEAAVLVNRACAYTGLDAPLQAGECQEILGIFTDHTSLNAWSVTAFAKNVKLGLISDQNTALRPQDQITRAEVATMVYRMMQKAGL